MSDSTRRGEAPEFFDRLQRRAIHERRRRWDSTIQALAGAPDSPSEPAAVQMPPELVAERFESLEVQLIALGHELRRMQRHARHQAIRLRAVGALGGVAATMVAISYAGPVRNWLVAFSAWLGH